MFDLKSPYSGITKRYFDYQAASHEFEQAVKNLNFADRQRAEASQESRKILSDYMGKILFYSVGAFSFLVALLRVIPDRNVFSKIGFIGLPNVYLMYMSMALYLLAAVFSLLSRRFDAYYVSFHSTQVYLEKFLNEREQKKYMFENYPDQMIIKSDKQEQIKIYNKDITEVKPAIEKNKSGTKLWYNMMLWFGASAEVFAAIATILLFIFTIELSQALIW